MSHYESPTDKLLASRLSPGGPSISAFMSPDGHHGAQSSLPLPTAAAFLSQAAAAAPQPMLPGSPFASPQLAHVQPRLAGVQWQFSPDFSPVPPGVGAGAGAGAGAGMGAAVGAGAGSRGAGAGAAAIGTFASATPHPPAATPPPGASRTSLLSPRFPGPMGSPLPPAAASLHALLSPSKAASARRGVLQTPSVMAGSPLARQPAAGVGTPEAMQQETRRLQAVCRDLIERMTAQQSGAAVPPAPFASVPATATATAPATAPAPAPAPVSPRGAHADSKAPIVQASEFARRLQELSATLGGAHSAQRAVAASAGGNQSNDVDTGAKEAPAAPAAPAATATMPGAEHDVLVALVDQLRDACHAIQDAARTFAAPHRTAIEASDVAAVWAPPPAQSALPMAVPAASPAPAAPTPVAPAPSLSRTAVPGIRVGMPYRSATAAAVLADFEVQPVLLPRREGSQPAVLLRRAPRQSPAPPQRWHHRRADGNVHPLLADWPASAAQGADLVQSTIARASAAMATPRTQPPPRVFQGSPFRAATAQAPAHSIRALREALMALPP